MFLVDDVHILVDAIIVDDHLSGLDFMCCIVSKMATTVVIQAKKGFDQNQYLANLFIPFNYQGLWVFMSIS
jgi:hypothetical protein